MKQIISTLMLAAMAAASGITSAADAPKGVVVTSENMSQRCILALVVTDVDGKTQNDAEAAGRFELDSGPHSFSGYAGGDPSLCATFSAEGGVKVAKGDRIGQSSLKLNVESGKEYYLGVDVRSPDKSRWKIVAWKIKH